MNRRIGFLFLAATAALPAVFVRGAAPGPQAPATAAAKMISAEDCTAAKLGSSIPVSAIGEPVAGVTLSEPRWVAGNGNAPAYCSVDGAMAPVDTSSHGRPINFRVVLPASWTRHAAQIGGGGFNGTIPNVTGGEAATVLQRGFATYGSDSGHQQGGGFGGGGFGGPGGRGRGGFGAGGPGAAGPRAGGPGAGGPAPAAQTGDDWTLSDEALKNIGYMQLKKTHDAAMVLMERLYGERPRYNYFIGTSQGGREGLTVAQRYPADYDGVAANVPIVNFSSLMLAPELIRIQEKPLANWVTAAKVEAIRAEFVRQCDKLDGLADGVMNNYMACRAIFDMSQGDPNRNPWTAKRCPNDVDPNPEDRTAAACLTDGQISTLKVVYSRYKFATPLAYGVKSFGMWVPNTDPSGSGLIANTRYKGQEGAAPSAANHSHLGVLGVTGFLMKDISANPLDYVEGGPLNKRREEISPWLDSTNPDLSAFQKRGGKMVVAIGTSDTLASPGAQLDYYQSVLDKMGRATVDEFARLYVIPQTTHSLTGNTYTMDGDGKAIRATQIPSRFDRLTMLFDWVEKGVAPAKSATVTGNTGSMPLCSYPTYPKYTSGPATEAASYTCTAP
ncbi:MAG TPA: tannase/feruloyl esterase family alpha/beta hydrolase [Terriglobia bacterium]|nr:tannase/feruloyl esterase family alpha/beta hydrolase [Terriglobia bacterium]